MATYLLIRSAGSEHITSVCVYDGGLGMTYGFANQEVERINKAIDDAKRTVSAEARAAELEFERMTIIETGDKLRDLVVQLRDERDTLRAKLAAEEAAHKTDVAALRRQIEALERELKYFHSTDLAADAAMAHYYDDETPLGNQLNGIGDEVEG